MFISHGTEQTSVWLCMYLCVCAQVFISYGTEQTSDSLLQYYGFTEPDNPKDTYTLTRAPDWLQKHIAVQPQRLRQIQEAGLKDALDKVRLSALVGSLRSLVCIVYVRRC